MSPSDDVFQTVLAGQRASEIVQTLVVLSTEDRQAMLCTVCALQDEIARTSLEHGQELQRLLESECPLFVDGVATCLLEDQTWKP